MRGATCSILVSIAWALTADAYAFHHHQQFQSPADGRSEVPGSGDLYYTGSRRDLGLRCSHCHVAAPGRIRANVAFSPDPGAGWMPGATYRVTVTMTGENAGLSGCGTLPNRNGMTAMIVGRNGFPIGQVSPDADARRCGNRFPPISSGQTTAVFGDCDGVVGVQGAGSLSRWQFDWRAPPAGSGGVSLWLGVVDGDCVFDSYRDDVYETRIEVPEGTGAALDGTMPPPNALAYGSRCAALPSRRYRV